MTSPTKDRIRIGRLLFVQNQRHFLHVCNLFPLLRATFCKIRGRPGKFDCFVLQNPTKDSQPCSHFCDTVTSTRLSIFKDVKKVLFCWSSWKALRLFYLKLDFSLLQLICQSSKLGRNWNGTKNTPVLSIYLQKCTVHTSKSECLRT